MHIWKSAAFKHHIWNMILHIRGYKGKDEDNNCNSTKKWLGACVLCDASGCS